MTSDAKIGLLLGLVFIFIIAFIINGLPRFRSTTNNSELTTNMVSSQNGTSGIAARERKAQAVINWPEQAEQQPPEEVQHPLEYKEDVRYKMKLPEHISVVKDTSAGQTSDEVELASRNPLEPAAPAPITEKNTQVKKPELVKPAFPKIYVVCDGDNLADIAKMFYGDIEGNKKVNIDRVFQANRKLLKSPDEIQVGQKLVVPLLSSKDETESTFSRTLFEKVKAIGRKHLVPDNSKAKQSKQYVVREGDNLWRIAAEQLGDGSRYEDISKLNANILEDEDTLIVGMNLRLPVR
ncbi:MAG: LysM peptidoglycan-binding domain-containing protein [Planctomycetota bacterium]|jgi:nucleoid-associated protein YgaU